MERHTELAFVRQFNRFFSIVPVFPLFGSSILLFLLVSLSLFTSIFILPLLSFIFVVFSQYFIVIFTFFSRIPFLSRNIYL